ncbi:hypothetical protein VTN77DRAFT_570 [Rasamsonia byssochlamydoides]|uniref:uncharacterized protein n=1 Tax=Rasamsonia byssochlamydoides TaxID=89139 RepID=UPI003742491A
MDSPPFFSCYMMLCILQHAIKENQVGSVRSLTEYRPDLQTEDSMGNTPLHGINSDTSLEIVKLLVNGGSDLEARNKAGDTPLSRAVLSTNIAAVKYLIRKKAQINIVGGTKRDPLNVACRYAGLEIIQTLIKAGADVNLVDPLHGTPLQQACYRDDNPEEQESVISYLINKAHADVSIVGGICGTAIHVACAWSTPNITKLILDQGANIDIPDAMGRVPVHFAAANSSKHFQLILDAGGDVETKDTMGRTALHWAVIGGCINIVERVLSLLRNRVDQPDNDGWTPLLWAARGCGTVNRPSTASVQKEMITLLLDRGADPCVKWNRFGREWSVIKLARYHNLDDAIVQLLEEKYNERLAEQGLEDTWDENLHSSAKAIAHDGFCDSCLSVCFFSKTRTPGYVRLDRWANNRPTRLFAVFATSAMYAPTLCFATNAA